MQKIIVTIPGGLDQSVRVAVEGVAGPGCRSLTRSLLERLGRTLQDTPTLEHDQLPSRHEQRLEQGHD